ncbi:MAG: TonB-dependent receptor [Crocinitomicaceae bacterium]|nr:TonB-dependent receptor [Crocinitomicaceae bacterium]
MKLIRLSFFLIIFLSTVSYSQNSSQGDGMIMGRIVNSINDKSMEYVSVRLFLEKDSSLLTGIYSDSEGKFLFDKLVPGSYYVKFSFAGFLANSSEKLTITSNLKVLNLGTISMELDKTLQIGQVDVVGQASILSAGIDKKVYNVAEDMSVKGGTANDVLKNIPSVDLDQDGRIMLRGDGAVTVLIDGRPSSLSGGNGKTLLDALPAGSIERIEIVTNPSAKYDPDGTSGIINIVLKKNKLKGFNGLLNANIGSGNFKGGNVADGGFSLSYRNSFFNIYGSYNGRYLDGYRNNTSYIRQTFINDSISILDQNRTGTDLNAGNTARFGVDFTLKNRKSISFSSTGSAGRRDRTGDLWNGVKDSNEALLSLGRRESYDPSQQHNYDFNANFKQDFKDSRGSFVLDANQSIGMESIQGYYLQRYYGIDSVLDGSLPLNQRLFNQEKNNITSIQADFTYLWPAKLMRSEFGAKTIIRKQEVNTYSETYDYSTISYFEDTLANFLYRYNEKIFSAYAIFGQQLNKFKYQGGVRVEKAYQIPNLVSDSIEIINDYFNFFPSAHLKYALTPKSEIGLSYSRRITRASSGDLNPFTAYSDPFNLRRGNPYLQPEFINSYDLAYSSEGAKLNFSAAIFYRHTVDAISRIKVFYDDNSSAVTFTNIGQSHSFGTELIASYKPTKWWRNTLSTNINYIQYQTSNALWNRNGFNWNVKYIGSVDFWKKTATVQLNVNYIAPRITVQGIAQRRGSVELSFDKKLMDGKWTVGARVSDIFNRQGFFMEVNQLNIYQVTEFKWLTRRVYLTVAYKFGKLEMGNKSKVPGSEGNDL